VQIYNMRRLAGTSLVGSTSVLHASAASCMVASASETAVRRRVAMQDTLNLHLASASREEKYLLTRLAVLREVKIAAEHLFASSGASMLPGAGMHRIGLYPTPSDFELLSVLSSCELAAADYLGAYALLESCESCELRTQIKGKVRQSAVKLARVSTPPPASASFPMHSINHADVGSVRYSDDNSEPPVQRCRAGLRIAALLPYNSFPGQLESSRVSSVRAVDDTITFTGEEDSAFVRPIASSQIRRQGVTTFEP
jgi:hypothetical protein